MGRVDLCVRGPFLHRGRIRSNRELQQVRRVPQLNGLNKSPGGKRAVTLGADSFSINFSLHREGDPDTELSTSLACCTLSWGP